jgi:hypothetical protein
MSLSPFGPLYELSSICISNGYSVLYGVESVPNEAAKQKVFESIENVNSTQEIRDKLSKGFLTVIDRESIHKEYGTDYNLITNFWNASVKNTEEKLQGASKGTMIFSAPDSYFKNDQHDIFMMFEEAMGRTFSTNTSMICWYLERWLSNLSLASFIKVLSTHKQTVHSGWTYKEWTENEIIDMISRGIDKRLGDGTANLLLQTMKNVHKLTQRDIVSRPILFEGILKRLLGSESSGPVIDTIIEQLTENIIW